MVFSGVLFRQVSQTSVSCCCRGVIMKVKYYPNRNSYCLRTSTSQLSSQQPIALNQSTASCHFAVFLSYGDQVEEQKKRRNRSVSFLGDDEIARHGVCLSERLPLKSSCNGSGDHRVMEVGDHGKLCMCACMWCICAYACMHACNHRPHAVSISTDDHTTAHTKT